MLFFITIPDCGLAQRCGGKGRILTSFRSELSTAHGDPADRTRGLEPRACTRRRPLRPGHPAHPQTHGHGGDDDVRVPRPPRGSDLGQRRCAHGGGGDRLGRPTPSGGGVYLLPAPFLLHGRLTPTPFHLPPTLLSRLS